MVCLRRPLERVSRKSVLGQTRTHVAQLAVEVAVRHRRQFGADENVRFCLPAVRQLHIGLLDMIEFKS